MPKTKSSWSADNPGPGRTPGHQNKLTTTVKEAVLRVFNELQDDKNNNLTAFAEKYPRDFYAIAAKLIPTEINAKINKVKLEIVRTTNGGNNQTSDEEASPDATTGD